MLNEYNSLSLVHPSLQCNTRVFAQVLSGGQKEQPTPLPVFFFFSFFLSTLKITTKINLGFSECVHMAEEHTDLSMEKENSARLRSDQKGPKMKGKPFLLTFSSLRKCAHIVVSLLTLARQYPPEQIPA